MNSVPFDIAASLDDVERQAWCIIMSEHNGSKFNWNLFQFEDRN